VLSLQETRSFENVYAITMFLAGEGLKICLMETVHKEDKEKPKRKRRIVAFVNWKMPKLALIL